MATRVKGVTKTERNGNRNETENKSKSLKVNKINKEYDLKQNIDLILNKILNQQYISIFGLH